MLGHQRDRLVVIDLALAEAELRVDRLASAEQLPRRPPRLPDQLPDLVLRERLDVVVDPVEVDAPLLEQDARFLHVVQVRFSYTVSSAIALTLTNAFTNLIGRRGVEQSGSSSGS